MEGAQNQMLIYDPWGIFKVRIVEDMLKRFNNYSKLQQTMVAGLTVTALDKKYFESVIKATYSWVCMLYLYCKAFTQRKKHIRTRIIQRISDERKINTLYECMSWYITNQVKYPDEKTLKCITHDTYENSYKNPALLLRIEQNNKRTMDYEGRTIEFELSINKVNIDGEDHSRQNDTITLSMETNDPNDKFLEDTFIPGCMKTYRHYLKTKNYQNAVYQNSDSDWKELAKQPTELKDTIVLQGDDKKYLLDEVNHFITEKQWYHDHGFPYSLGVLLYGAPGCGKTSIIRLVSHITKRNTHYLRLSQIHSEKQFNQLMERVSLENTILVLEDIDCVDWVKERSVNKPKDEIFNVVGDQQQHQQPVNITIGESKPTDSVKQDKMNLEILLSILDGMRTVSGQIVFVTTNHKDVLDEALIREGRIDVQMELKRCNADMITELATTFYKGKCMVPNDVPVDIFTPAKIMNIFRHHKKDPNGAFQKLAKLKDETVAKLKAHNNKT